MYISFTKFFWIKKFIRLNANYIILFKLSKRNLNDVYNSIVDNIKEKNEFKALADYFEYISKKNTVIKIHKSEIYLKNSIFCMEYGCLPYLLHIVWG